MFIVIFQYGGGATIVPAIIQNDKIKDSDYGSIFNYTVIFAICFSMVFSLGLGEILKLVWSSSIYQSVSWFLSITLFCTLSNSVPNGLFYKNKMFKLISIRIFISQLLGAVISIWMAFHQFGIYALVFSWVVPAVIELIWNLVFVPFRFTLSLNRKPILKLLPFASGQAGFNILNYASRNIDNFLVGKIFGSSLLGYYSKSYSLISMPMMVLSRIFNPVLQPVLAVHERNVKMIKHTFLIFAYMLAIISIPVSILFSLNSKLIIILLFGNQWEGAILPMTILSLSIWCQTLMQSFSPFWMSRNLTNYLFYNSIISFFLIALFILIGIMLGNINYVALLVASSYFANMLISSRLLMRHALDGEFVEFIKIILKPLGIGVILFIILWQVQCFLQFSSVFLELLIRTFVWLFLTVAMYCITGEMKKIKTIIKKGLIAEEDGSANSI